MRRQMNGWRKGRIRTSASGEESDIRLEDCDHTRREVWTRVMGYHRPVFTFSAGERSEHQERQYFVEYPADLDAE